MDRLKTFEDFHIWQSNWIKVKSENKPSIRVCDGTGCRALGSQKVITSLREEVAKANLEIALDIIGTGCPGFCECGPLVTIYPQQISYQKVKPQDSSAIVHQTIIAGEIIEKLLYIDPKSTDRILEEYNLPFYQKQNRIVLDFNGKIDPKSIQDYIGLGGYRALVQVLATMAPDQVIEEVRTSGLRGRGGAGFPTGLKWEFCRKNIHEAGLGYIVCNADEGDPGAFMDRSILEGNPHAIIEGMIIGGYAMGVHQGFIYIRAEYPLAITNLRTAIQQAGEAGLLGTDILGSGFDFSLDIRLGAGAFVCGEETALMASIEGRVGEPRPRPPYPAQSGLWGCPTNINNVKTWATVPMIINKGAGWYASIGTEHSKGTMIFSVVGKINNTGLVEVPMGISLRELIFDIGGGIPKGKQFKAAQIGGPSGGCIPAEHLDVKIDYESLTDLGAIMGSGGLVVADEDTCMVDFARYFMAFTQEESCGKCVPCRIGTRAMLSTLERICAGAGQPVDMDYLQELGGEIKRSSLCGLGQTAPNPVLSTLRYFREEYEAHIWDHTCPAKVCKGLITYSVISENCTGCMVCLRNCPANAIQGEKNQVHMIASEACTRCGTCKSLCQFDAISIQ